MSDADPSSSADEASGGIPREPTGEYSVDGVRDELRRLGYLDHKVERFLLQDALKPENPASTLLHLTAKVGLLIGAPSALLLAWVLAAINGHLEHRPLDLLPLFLHLLPPLALLPALGFLVLAAVLAFFLRIRHVRRIEGLSFGIAWLAALVSVAVALWQGWGFLPVLPRWQVVALLLAVPFMAWAILEVVHGGLLTLAIRLTDLAPEKPSSHGRWVVLGLVLATFLGMIPAALEAGVEDVAEPPSVPMSDRGSESGAVVVIGIDGVLAQELDFLLASRGAAGDASAELPHLRRLLDDGGRVATYRRPANTAPPAFWTTVATGIPAPLHGMESLDSFRPVGMNRPLRRSGWLRAYWRLLADAGWVEYRPVLSGERSAWTFWELAGRAGEGALSIDWWGTFPAHPSVGITIAHGAYSHLREAHDQKAGQRGVGAELPAGTLEPPRLVDDLIPLLDASRREPPALLVAGLRGVGAGELVEKALRPDAFYADAFESVLRRRPRSRAAALYLPGLDIAAGLADPGSVAQATMVRWQLHRVDALVGRLQAAEATRFGTLVLVADPGRRDSLSRNPSRGSAEGRVIVWSRSCGSATTQSADQETSAALPDVTPAEIGSFLFRAIGLPQSREIPLPPELCPLPSPPLTVESFGVRHPPESQAERGDEYLEQLRSLGYL